MNQSSCGIRKKTVQKSYRLRISSRKSPKVFTSLLTLLNLFMKECITEDKFLTTNLSLRDTGEINYDGYWPIVLAEDMGHILPLLRTIRGQECKAKSPTIEPTWDEVRLLMLINDVKKKFSSHNRESLIINLKCLLFVKNFMAYREKKLENIRGWNHEEHLRSEQ